MGGVGSEETVSDHGPVLEEFIPLKPSLSLSSSEEDSTHAAGPTDAGKKEEAETPERRLPPPENKKATPDWLQSVQLWSQEPQQSSPDKVANHTYINGVLGSSSFLFVINHQSTYSWSELKDKLANASVS